MLSLHAQFKGGIISNMVFRLVSSGLDGIDQNTGKEHRLPSKFKQFPTVDKGT